MKAKHTKGPWKIGGSCNRHIVAPGGMEIASCRPYYIRRPAYDEAVANARLIAAAPELLEALEATLKITCGACAGDGGKFNYITPDGFDACLLARQAKAAIAKAKGE